MIRQQFIDLCHHHSFTFGVLMFMLSTIFLLSTQILIYF